MLFPDYFVFADKRLVNHIIETKYVKDLDHCELFCYMNDNCVSANFKKEPETGGTAYVCELNNATHLEYDTDLSTNAVFLYRGSKVNYKLWVKFSNLTLFNELWKTTEMCQNFRCFNPLSIIQDIHLSSCIIFFFFLFRTSAVKTFRVKIMQLVSPVSQSRDIDACALLDSKENIAKKVNYRMCP